MSQFLFWQGGSNAEWIFHLVGENDQIVLTASELYKTREGCLIAIQSAKRNGSNRNNYSSSPNTPGGYFYLHDATTNRVIAKSQPHDSELSRKNGIRKVIADILVATVNEVVKRNSLR